MRFEILMATWQGERYLKDQLDSLLAQDYPDLHITIRDDGSTDGTIPILRDYQKKYPEQVTLLEDHLRLGYPDCFWTLLQNAPDADMYAWCDQDDVWMPEKLSCCAEKCDPMSSDLPLLYLHDYQVSDPELNISGEHRLVHPEQFIDKPWLNIFYVFSQGFTLIMNHALRQRILRNSLLHSGIAHDKWTLWAGIFSGKIVFDSRLLAIYRRHQNTTTQTGKNLNMVIKEWWREDLRGNRLSQWGKAAIYFEKCYGQEMKAIASGLPEIWHLVAGGNRTISGYFRRLLLPRRLKPTLFGEAALRLCFLLNR